MREACALPPGGAARVQEGGLSPRGGIAGTGAGRFADACPAALVAALLPCVLFFRPPSPCGGADGFGKGFGLLVSLGCRRRRPCTCDLSTSSSPTALPDWTSYL